jgi:hypothetical protein
MDILDDRPAAGPPFFILRYKRTDRTKRPTLKSADPIQTLPRVTFIDIQVKIRKREIDVISILFSPLHRTGKRWSTGIPAKD